MADQELDDTPVSSEEGTSLDEVSTLNDSCLFAITTKELKGISPKVEESIYAEVRQFAHDQSTTTISLEVSQINGLAEQLDGIGMDSNFQKNLMLKIIVLRGLFKGEYSKRQGALSVILFNHIKDYPVAPGQELVPRQEAAELLSKLLSNR
jgi:hypothetical protein